jgi:hypothetical protein
MSFYGTKCQDRSPGSLLVDDGVVKQVTVEPGGKAYLQARVVFIRATW